MKLKYKCDNGSKKDLNIGLLRKAETTHGMLIILVLFSVSIVFMLFVLYKLGIIAYGTTDKTLCKSSIELNEKAHLMGKGLKPETLNCPTNHFTIKEDKDRAIQRQVAEEMKLCWDTFKKGNVDLFHNSAIFCSVCSTFDFKKKGKELNFYEYIKETSPLKEEVSYLDYFINYKTPTTKYIDESNLESQSLESIESFTLDTSKMYSVVFVYVKGKDAFSRFKNKMGAVKTGSIIGGGATIGTALVITVATGGIGGLFTLGAITAVSIAGVASFIYTIFSGEEVEYASFILLKEHTKSDLADIGCEYFPSIQE
jgi:hypothetical protein